MTISKMKSVDVLRPIKNKRNLRPDRRVSIKLDPMSLEKVHHLSEVIKVLANKKEVSVDIIVRRAIEALISLYDDLMTSTDIMKNDDEVSLLTYLTSPDDCGDMKPFNFDPLQTFSEKLSRLHEARALANRSEIQRWMKEDTSVPEELYDNNHTRRYKH